MSRHFARGRRRELIEIKGNGLGRGIVFPVPVYVAMGALEGEALCCS
jgi:hypothetical protein